MTDRRLREKEPETGRLYRAVASRTQRRRRRRREAGVWASLGMMGLVGWSIAVPTLIGAALGGWLDQRWPTGISWRLTLLVAGVVVGCFNAWHWIWKEGGA